jgi:hypothetical protein
VATTPNPCVRVRVSVSRVRPPATHRAGVAEDQPESSEASQAETSRHHSARAGGVNWK